MSSSPPADQASSLGASERALYDALMRPDDQGPAPTVEKKSTAGSIFRLLGDAVSTYASIMGRTNGLETQSFQKYLDQLERQKSDKQAYDEKTDRAKTAAELRGREFLYTAEERRASRANEQAGREELKRMGAEQQRLDREARVAEQAADRAAREKEMKQKNDWDKEMEAARFTRETAVANIRKRAAEGDEIAKDDDKKLGDIIANIGGLAEVAKERLAAGDTPEQMNARVRRMIDAARVSPEARKAAENYYNEEMGTILRDYQTEKQNKELAAGSPDANMAGPAHTILERLGSVRTPQKF
jgi:hypothetical protein